MHLSPDRIVAAALNILDEYGLADLTMRRLGQALNVAPGALYWHFPNKQKLLGGVADELLADVIGAVRSDRGWLMDSARSPLQSEGWQGQLEELCHRYRTATLSHRDAAELLASAIATGSVDINLTQAVVRIIENTGLPAERVEHIAMAILAYLQGITVYEQSALQLASYTQTEPAPLAERTAQFDTGVRILLAGVAAEVTTDDADSSV